MAAISSPEVREKETFILSTDEYGYGSDYASDRELGELVRIVKFSV